MKVILIVGSLFSTITLCQAQWTLSYGNCQVLAIGAVNNSCFIGVTPVTGLDAPLYRYIKPRLWVDDDTAGFDQRQGVVTSFATLGNDFFANVMHTNGAFGPAFRSSDGGFHWKRAGVGSPLYSDGAHLFAVYLGQFGLNRIIRSLDAGHSWDTVLNIGARSFTSIASNVIASTDSGIYYSTNNGLIWNRATSPLSNVRSFAVAGSNVYATNGIPDTKVGQLMRSLDSGANWSLVSTPSFTVQCLASDGKHLFAGGHEGLYLLDTDGVSWLPKTDSLPHPAIVALGVFDTLLFADMSYSGYFLYSRSLPAMFGEQKSDVQTVVSKDTISIYPNPTLSSVRIDFGSAAVRRVELLDVLGASKQVLAPRESILTLDLAPLPSGTYFLRFETEKGIVMRKIVKE